MSTATAGRSNVPGFGSWLEDVKVEIEQVQELVAEKLSDNPAVLYEQLAKVEAWHGRMTTMLAEANSFLDLAEYAALIPKQEGVTDVDRRVRQAAAVVNERKMRDIVEGLCQTIQTKLMLGMSLKKQSQGERSGFQP